MSINLHLGDCLKAMRAMPDNSYELAIVDPPYGIGEDGKKNHSRTNKTKAKEYTPKNWDNQAPTHKYFDELFRVSKNVIIWGANHFLGNMLVSVPKLGFLNSHCWIVWDKDNSGDFADCELAFTSFDSAVRKFTWRWNGMLQQDMKNKEVRIHPTQKPVKLYEWLLDNYAKEGDRILDTHLGSGSIAIACHNRGYSLDAFEIDEEYYNAATERLRAHQSQLTIF
jgi:site-specific DNA-methyltransferase (adenine-specific)